MLRICLLELLQIRFHLFIIIKLPRGAHCLKIIQIPGKAFCLKWIIPGQIPGRRVIQIAAAVLDPIPFSLSLSGTHKLFSFLCLTKHVSVIGRSGAQIHKICRTIYDVMGCLKYYAKLLELLFLLNLLRTV